MSQAVPSGDQIAIPVAATAAVAPTPSAAATQNAAPSGGLTAEVAKRPDAGLTPDLAAAANAAPLVANSGQPAGAVYGPTPAGTLATRERIERTLPPRAQGSANYLRNAPGPPDPAAQPSPSPRPSQTRPPINLTDLPESPSSAS